MSNWHIRQVTNENAFRYSTFSFCMKLFTLSALAAYFVAQASARAVGSDGKLVVAYSTTANVSTLNFSQIDAH